MTAPINQRAKWYAEQAEDCSDLFALFARCWDEAFMNGHSKATDKQLIELGNLILIIADIREKSGVGLKPALSELADAIAAKVVCSVKRGRCEAITNKNC